MTDELAATAFIPFDPGLSRVADMALSTLTAELHRLAKENCALRNQLRVDRLTGIYNSLALTEYVEASRYDGYYVFADGDGLGRLNKEIGHDAVDQYISEFGSWLKAQVRLVRDGAPDGEERRSAPSAADAIAVRQHGDEFMVWCSNKIGAQRIRNAIRRWHSSDGAVTFSAGMGRERDIADANCTAFKQQRKAA